MEFSCAYFHHNRNVLFVIFARRDNLIYINLLDQVRVVMTMDMLLQDYLLSGYYHLSLFLTENVHNLTYFEKGTWGEQVLCNWCISSKVIWKLSKITDYFSNTAGFSSDPRQWTFRKSTCRKIDRFFAFLYDNPYYQHCPYEIMNYYISYEIDEIGVELENIEKETEKIDFTIKTVALLTSNKFAYPIPHDIIRLCI
jgi:hypothetical protein